MSKTLRAGDWASCCGSVFFFIEDTDPAFYLNSDMDPDPGSQTNADPCGSGSCLDFAVTKS